MADQTERLKKLYALAIRGVGGEKEQAQKLLEKLMQKYGVSLAELDEEQIKDFDIEVHGEFERKLLRQVVYKITGDPYDGASFAWRDVNGATDQRSSVSVAASACLAFSSLYLLRMTCRKSGPAASMVAFSAYP